MALTKELKAFLEDTLGVKTEVLKEALTSDDEVRIELRAGTFMLDDDLENFKKKVGSQSYNEGTKAGVEMAIKSAREKFGLEFEGKTIDNFADALTKKVIADAKIEPNKKVEELSSSLSKLQSTYQNDLSAKDQEIQKLSNQLNTFSINQKLMSELPENISINQKHFLALAQTEYGFQLDESGNVIPMRNGQPVKDKLENVVPVRDVLSEFAQSNGYIGKPRGRGKDDDYQHGGASEFKSMNDVYRHMDKNKIDPLSAEGQALVQKFEQQNG